MNELLLYGFCALDVLTFILKRLNVRPPVFLFHALNVYYQSAFQSNVMVFHLEGQLGLWGSNWLVYDIHSGGLARNLVVGFFGKAKLRRIRCLLWVMIGPDFDIRPFERCLWWWNGDRMDGKKTETRQWRCDFCDRSKQQQQRMMIKWRTYPRVYAFTRLNTVQRVSFVTLGVQSGNFNIWLDYPLDIINSVGLAVNRYFSRWPGREFAASFADS